MAATDIFYLAREKKCWSVDSVNAPLKPTNEQSSICQGARFRHPHIIQAQAYARHICFFARRSHDNVAVGFYLYVHEEALTAKVLRDVCVVAWILQGKRWLDVLQVHGQLRR